ncbi:MAG: arylsulfatase [Anditalea sp.]
MNKLIPKNLMILIGVLYAVIIGGTDADAVVLSDNAQEKPNIILIMTDDQGIGDIGYLGNPFIRTPNLDHLAANSTRFTNFHVNPVCSSTRAALMTGKYPEKTGIYDTFNGGAIMDTKEITIAELLKDNGYRTGIFGKWHLGDSYPYRSIDQGFDNSLVHKGGGIGQPGDIDNYAAGDRAYFDPVLYKNGKKNQSKGYCSDVFTEGAIDFIQHHDGDPFFLYLSFNAPHTPLQVPQKYYDMYKDISLEEYKQEFHGKDSDIDNMTEKDLDDARKIYGMVTNIDENIGKLLKALKRKKIDDNTIIIFLSDNGPQQKRYKLDYRDRKTSVYEGGVRVPFFIYGPGRDIPKNKEIDMRAAHIDLLPTILELSKAKAHLPNDIDGYNLFNHIQNKDEQSLLSDRTIFTEWGRGYAIPYQNMSVHKGDYKLVAQTDYQASVDKFELYNLTKDPSEANNLINQERERAMEMKAELDAWLNNFYAHPKNNRIQYIKIGTPFENPVILSRHDAKGPIAVWSQPEIYGYWDVEIMEEGTFDITFHFFENMKEPGKLFLKLYPYHFSIPNNNTSTTTLEMKNIRLAKGIYKLEPHYSSKTGKNILPFYVEVEKKN